MPPTKTPEQIEQETIDLIDKAIKDSAKGLATRDEVIALIDDRKQADTDQLNDLLKKYEAMSEAEKELAEVKETAAALQGQLKRLRQERSAGSTGSYRGKLGSIEEARTLGLIMMAASLPAGRDIPELSSKYSRVMKALEKSSTDLIYVEEKTGKRIDREKAATGTSQASGSLLVTSEMGPGLIMLLNRYGLARRLFSRVPMGAGSTFTPKLDTLPTFYVPGEGNATTVTDILAKGVNLIPKALTALGAYSMELDEDSAVELGELYGNWFARGAAYYEDLCAILGDGSGTYFGFQGICGALRAVDATIANIKSLVVGSGNAYSELVYGDFESVVGTVPQYTEDEDGNSSASWIMHRYFYYTVFIRAALAAGTAGAHQEIILGTAQRKKQAIGYPVNFSPVMPKAEANSQICSLFGDYELGAQFGTRGAMEFATSDQRYFDQGLVALRCRDRVAVNAHGVGNTTDAGPIVGLITAAS